MLIDTGLVFLSDSRTNAGVDQISTFRKVTVFERPGDRIMVLLSSGNLAISQAVVNILQEQIAGFVPGREQPANLHTAINLFEATRCVGDALREVHRRDAAALEQHGIEFSASFIFGGQVGSEPPRLFLVYAAGNFIEATYDTPYFQIGESKYGKPIIDRVVTRSTSLAEAAKCALISMDSTIRSNLSVGAPLDLVCVRRDTLKVSSHVTMDAEHDYFRMIRRHWSESLRHAFHELPDPDWLRNS